MKSRNQASEIARARLHRQHLVGPADSVAEVARRLCAVQGQDYAHSLWAFGGRLSNPSQRDVESAIEDGTIVRTWPMRGTLHLVHSSDARWMLQLLAPDMIARHSRRLGELGITDAMVERSQSLMMTALSGGRRSTRARIYALFEDAGLATREIGYHLLWRAALDLVICIGPREGNQQTFVLFDEWVPPSDPLPREEALARLAARYFVGHGPATVADFQWWSGLKVGDARRATHSAEGIDSREIDGREYWFAPDAFDPDARAGTIILPAFDEYLVAYRDRSAVLAPEMNKRVNAGGGLLDATVIRGGRVVATWKRKLTGKGAVITVSPFETPGAAWKRDVERAFRRWVDFHSLEAAIIYPG